MARLQFPPSGGDLEPGSAGVAPIPGIAACATLTFCLTGCDASSNARCDASGSIGNTSLNGVYAGPPQPTISGGVPVCLVHRWEHDITGTIALDDGSVSLDVGLLTDVYLTSASEPCPICESTGDLGSVGRCSATARTPGVSCLLEARDETSGRGLSSSCLPATPVAALSRVEFPLTTGAARLPLNSAPACLEGAPPARIGNASVPQPPWPEPSYPKTATGVLLVGAFCATPTAQLPLGSPIPPSRGRITLPVDALTVYGPP